MFPGKLPFFIVMIMVVALQLPGAYGDLSTCQGEKKALVSSCRPVIFGLKPSADCCAKVRAARVECVCPSVSSKTAALLGGVARAIRKIEACGRPVPHNFKCGSVTTP